MRRDKNIPDGEDPVFGLKYSDRDKYFPKSKPTPAHATPPSITVYVPLTEEDCFNISNGKIKVRKFKQTLKILNLPDFEYIKAILNDMTRLDGVIVGELREYLKHFE